MEEVKKIILPDNILNREIRNSNFEALNFFIPFLTIIGIILVGLDFIFFKGFKEENSIYIHLAHWFLFLPNLLMWFFIRRKKNYFPILAFSMTMLAVFLTLLYDLRVFTNITVYIYGIMSAFFILYFKPKEAFILILLSFIIFVLLLTTMTPINKLYRSNLINGTVATIIAFLFARIKNNLLYKTFVKEYQLKKSKEEIEVKNNTIEDNFKQLQEYEKKKDKMLAAVAHELNTPLSVIYGHLNLIKSKLQEDDTFEKPYFAIERNVKRLMNNVSKILDLMKSQVTDSEEKEEIIELKKYLKPICYDYNALAKEKGKHFHNKIMDVKLFINRENLQIIIENLLDNAFKYSKAGSNIHFFAESTGEKVKIGVEDEGLGVADDDKDRILEEFYRAKLGKTKQIPGLGLGLSIVNGLLAKYNSKLEYTSELDKGSTFYFYLDKYEG